MVGRPKVSIVGVGDWGCEVLSSLSEFNYALAIAVTDDEGKHWRHPAARVVEYNEPQAFDDLIRLLSGTDILFLVWSEKDVKAVKLSLDLARESSAWTICVVGSNHKHHEYDSLQNVKSILLVDYEDDVKNISMTAKYIEVIKNILWKHRIMGIDFRDLVTLTNFPNIFRILQVSEMKVNSINKINDNLSTMVRSEASKAIICYKYNSQSEDLVRSYFMGNTHVFEKLHDSLQFLIAFVPHDKNNYEITAISFAEM